ncbi:MAG: recombination protein RecR [Bacilli bacterium]|nr:recombination protein RecR [Bacilli bacterium]
MYPESLKKLIESFRLLPGVGEKTAERMAFSILDFDEENIDYFSDSLKEAKAKIHPCSICNTLTDQEKCSICSDEKRNKKKLCVVDDSKSVFMFERLKIFDGVYHVLKGLINPLEGVNPEDIGIEKLLERVKKENFEEIIFALTPSIEGETTVLYIKQILDDNKIKITKLASGVPVGAEMEYMDVLTLERALSERKEVA